MLRSRLTVRRLLGLFSGDLSVAAIALGLSMTLWVAVANERNPVTAEYLPTPLQVQINGQAQDLVRLTGPEPVRVRLSGPRDSIQRLQPGSLRASIDLTDKGAGEHRVDVAVKTSDESVRVTDISPPTVLVRLDKLEEKTIPVRANATGQPSIGFVSRTAEVEPMEIKVSGPLSIVHSATAAVASVSLDGEKKSIDRSVPPTVVDNQGRLVEGLQLERTVVRVQVPIEEELSYRPLPVRTQITGTVASGYWVEGVTVEPAVVTVFGPRVILQSLTAVDASSVSISGLSDGLVRTVSLVAPSGTTLASALTATVRVTIAPVRGTITILVAPSYQGLAPLRTATAPSVQVTLAGPVPVLRRVEPSQVKVTVDLTNQAPGSHALTPSVVVPDGLTLVNISPEKLTVEVK